MLSPHRVFAGVLACGLLIGGVSIAPVNAENALIAQATSRTGTLAGVATDANGAPLVGATILLSGPAVYTATTGPGGAYLFPSVVPGIYRVRASATGFNSASDTYAAAAGVAGTLNVTLAAQTLSSIREIGRVTSNSRRAGFNSSPASVAIVDSATFVDQGQPQVQRILDQTPGIVIDHPGTNANNAAPGAITFPSIRGGLGFETASLIDGHPLAVGNFGDYVTTFLNSYVLSGVELIKGPGAAAPEINYAIGGTVNFRTLDPTPKLTQRVVLGADSFGGQFSNFLYSGTSGRLGYVFDYAVDGTPGPLRNAPGTTTLSTGTLLNCAPVGGSTAGCQKTAVGMTGSATNAATNGIQNNPNYVNTSLVACCIPISQTFDAKTELVKLRYNLSNTTTATASYLGSQTWTDQNGNHVYQYSPNFLGGQFAGLAGTYAAANGGLPPGVPVNTVQSVFFPATSWEINNEPIFQAEIRSSFKGDNVIGRFYGASINRLQYNGLSSNTQLYTTTLNLQGVASQCPAGAVVSNLKCSLGGVTTSPVANAFNGNYPVTFAGAYFRSAEEDKLHGGTIEYDHFLKGDAGNLLSFAYDMTSSNTHAYDYDNSGNAPSVAAGSRQRFQTILVRGIFNVTDKINVTVSNYFDSYYQRYTSDGGATFKEANTSRYDGRLGLAFKAASNFSARFSMGSAIAPPYLNLLDRTNSPPLLAAGGTYATNNVASGTLTPETSFGYDLGFDLRAAHDPYTVATGDIYRTNLQNQFLQNTFANGTASLCPTGYTQAGGTCTQGATTLPTATVPLYSTGVTNLSNTRYEGIEAGLRRTPPSGFGYLIQGALIRAYAYNISPCIYSTTVVNGVLNCNAINTNLAVINGINFQNSGTVGSPGSFNSVSNHAIPYSQGYMELSYQTPSNARVSAGMQYTGPNNSLNVPAFVSFNANARIPVGSDGRTSLAINADNVFNMYGNAYINAFGGTPVPLENGKLGLTNGNSLTPRTFRFSITRNFGK